MHNAPSVNYPAGRSRFGALLLAAAWLLGCSAAASWAWLGSPGAWRLAVMLAVLAAAGSLAAWGWQRAPEGELSWNGEQWEWPGDGPGTIEVGVDLQRVMLLRWKAGPARRWIWLERARRPQRWDDLRRAVYSRARSHVLNQAPPDAAKP